MYQGFQLDVYSKSFSSFEKHETWRDEAETDNMPKVKRRDGTFGDIEKTRGFLNYNRNQRALS